MCLSKGVGAGIFLSCEGFLLEFPQTCPISFRATFSPHSSRMLYGMTSKNRSSCDFANIGGHFFKSNNVGRHFAHIFREFDHIFKDFVKIFSDFAQIFTKFAWIFRDFVRILSKSKFWVCVFSPCPRPTPLYLSAFTIPQQG